MLDIFKIDLKFCKKDSFIFKTEGLKHIKVLPWLSVVQSVEGSYDIAIGNGPVQTTGSGGIFIAPSNVQQTIVHHNDPNKKQITCRWVFIDAVINDIYRFDFLYDFPLIVSPAERALINAQFDLLFSSDNPFDNYCCYYEIVRILSRIAKPKTNSAHVTLQNTLSYIHKHYAEEIAIADLANNAHMSCSNFYAVFKKHFDTSPIAYLNHYRMSLAAELLCTTDKTISEISDSVGFKDSLYFSRTFKKTYGMPPSEYRVTHI